MTRGILAGTIAIRWLTTAPTTMAAPTQAQLTAGINLVGSNQNEELAEMDGWNVEPSILPTPGYASNRVGNVTGDQSYGQASMAFYSHLTIRDIWTALADGNTGWVAIMDFGQAATRDVEIFPATVMSRVRRRGDRGVRMYDVNFSIGAPISGTQAV
jgi:hypothetical protein